MTRAENIQQKLERIVDDLKRRNGRKNYLSDIQAIKDQLCQIDEEMRDSAIHETDGTIAPGQAMIADLLNEAHELSSDLMEEAEDD